MNADLPMRPPTARCPGCGVAHVAGSICQEMREAAWSIIRDHEARRRFPKHYRWARALLGLDEERGEWKGNVA